MAPVLEGLQVLDLSWGMAGPVATMLLADAGADVVKVEPPGGDPFRATPGYIVWNRGKRSMVLDLATPDGRGRLEALALTADVLVESFAPGTMARLGLDHDRMAVTNPRLITCSITGYGRHGAVARRPGWDALVAARSGLMGEQPGLRPGPVFLHLQLPSYGAALAAVVGIQAALCAREVTGRGQWVETSLMQGALLWTTQIWKRAEHPTPPLGDLWKFKELGPTPCFEGSDGRWFHPMPGGIPVALAHLGRDPGEISPVGIATGDLAVRTAYFAAARDVYLQRPAQEWVDLLQANDVPCQMIQPGEDALDHPQVVHNGAVLDLELPGVGTVRQVGRTYTLERHETATPTPPPAVGQHTEEVLANSRPPLDPSRDHGDPAATLRHPLDGVRVLDFGTAIAGPFSGMLLGDLGADVIKVDGLLPSVGTPGDAVWAAGARGKRSICIDLKHPEGQAIASKLIASADVLHYNLRTGVAERLGYGYEQAKAINPGIVFCHLTGYGNTGPLARWPGVDQMAQALCGLEHEQGATDDGGHPTWLRFGMVDAVTGLLSVIGVLQGLYSRHRNGGQGQAVAADILSAGMLLASDAFRGPDALPTRGHLDARQMGLGPLYRLYEAADGWLCLAAPRSQDWDALRAALPEAGLDDERFATAEGRDAHADALAARLQATFADGKVEEWWAHLDAHGVACEIATETAGQDWWDDPDAVANEWVASYPHPVWGRLEQPGRFFDFSDTPGRLGGAPPIIGGQTREVLLSLGYTGEEADDLKARGVVAW